MRETVKRKPENAEQIHGLVLLAFEAAFKLRSVFALFRELHKHDALIPYLTIRCSREPADEEARELLLETYISQLWTLQTTSSEHDADNTANEGEKAKLECQIRCVFFLLFNSKTIFNILQFRFIAIFCLPTTPTSISVIDVLLKHRLLSCAFVCLQRHKSAVSQSGGKFSARIKLGRRPMLCKFSALSAVCSSTSCQQKRSCIANFSKGRRREAKRRFTSSPRCSALRLARRAPIRKQRRRSSSARRSLRSRDGRQPPIPSPYRRERRQTTAAHVAQSQF